VKKSSVKKGAILASVAIALSSNVAGANSAAPVYMESVASSVKLTPVVSAGDMIGTYLVPGIPDGLGVVKSGDKLRIITNHEWSATNAIAAGRNSAGGLTQGSFISEMHYDLNKKSITKAKDFITDTVWYNYATSKFGTKPVGPKDAAPLDEYKTPNHSSLLNRFCSATLAPEGSFYDKKSGLGYQGAVFLTGEEGSDESRGFVANMEGQLVQIPGFGLSAWENLIPTPNKGKTTGVMGMEDGAATDSQLWMYQGTKTKTGTWYDKAGFTNGSAYVLAQDPSAVVASDNEIRAKYGKNTPFKVKFAQIDATLNGKAQNDQAREKGIELARVEDGSFDPKNPNDFYFVTTESNKDPKATASNPATPTVSRDGGALWRLRFADVANPAKGGTLEMLLDGSEAPLLSKPDNMTVDVAGNVLIQEDPGNNALVARIVSYRIKDGAVGVVAKFKDEYFAEGAASLITKDEESSGIIDVTEFFTKGKTDKNRYYMYVAQVHGAIANARPDIAAGDTTLPKAIEAGQWYLMTISDWAAVYTK
jgi:hypothetical protein